MLTRIITALVLAPLALAGIYFLNAQTLALVVAVIVGVAAYEWAGLVFASTASPEQPASAVNNPTARFIVVVVFTSTVLAICGWLWLRPDMQPQWLFLAAICWAWAIVEVLIYPRQIAPREDDRGPRRNLRWVVFGLIALPAAWSAILLLRQQDPDLLVLACFLVWGADAGAYFVGKAIGEHKLAPKVSPGKTWEGALGGAAVGLLVALGFGWFRIEALNTQLLAAAGAGLVLIAVSVFGDLFESILKRTAGAKDSGRLLPGHGGMLDRIDALIAVLPPLALIALSQ